MKRSEDKAVFHLFLPKADIEMFQRLYPHCQTRFFGNCLKLALNDSSFFDKIFFGVERK